MLAFMLALCLLGTSAHAQDVTSESRRQADHVTLMAGVFIPTQGIGQTVSVGWFARPDALVDADLQLGLVNIGLDDSSTSLSSQSLGLRWFLGNSFNGRIGLRHRLIEGDNTILYRIGTEASRLRDFGLDLAIGNRWQWSWFTLGVDWLGYFAPVVHTSVKQLALAQYYQLGLRYLSFSIGGAF